MRDYLPYTDAELLLWLTNFKNKILQHGSNYGISSEEMAAIDAQGEMLQQAVHAATTKKEEASQATAYKNEVRAAYLTTVRKSTARLKTHQHYTESFGKELGIIGTTATFDASSYKPSLTAEVTGGVVRIKFQKNGVDGVNIYSRRKGEVSWRFLARDTRSPYDDHIKLVNPSQPEHWEYRAYGVLNDVEIGQPSDVVEVIFGE